MITKVYISLVLTIASVFWISGAFELISSKSTMAMIVGLLMLPALLFIPRIYRFGTRIKISKTKNRNNEK